MSDDHTTRLQLPYLAAAQAQKHVTLNAALARLDGLVACHAVSRSVAVPPAAPASGDLYIAPVSGGSGDWLTASAGDLLRWDDGVWAIEPSPPGLIALVEDEAKLCVRGPAGWGPLGDRLGEAQALTRLGVGTDADEANPFAAKVNAVLLTARAASEGGDGDLRLTLNKEAASDVLSLLFQTGYAGRAEIGLIGDDQLRLRVSSDGASFVDALVIETDGRVGLGTSPAGARLAVGGVPPAVGALSAVGPAGGVCLALSDNVNSSLYVTNATGGAIVGTDGGGNLHLAAGGHTTADRRLSLDALAGTAESGVLLWIDTGGGVTPRRVSVGPVDSAGSGFRQLRAPN